MKTCALLFLVTSCTLAGAQQLPPGTRDAQDTSRANAASAALRDAESALEQGDFASAQTQLRALAQAHPQDAHILYDLGFASEHTGADAAAADAYKRAVAADATLAEPRVALGLLEARGGQRAEARADLGDAAALTAAAPALRATAYRALAQLDQQNRPSDASAELLAAIQLTRETPEDTALSASLALHTGDPTAAEAAYRHALAADPANIQAAVGLAHLLQSTGRSAEVADVLRPARLQHPDDATLASAQASALAATGRVAEAIQELAPLAEASAPPAEPALLRQLGRLYLLNAEPARAETLLRRALRSTPNDPALLDDVATTLVQQRRYADAQAILVRAVGMRGAFATPADFGDAAGHLAFAASKNGQPQVCLQALALRATVLPNSPSSLFLEATAHDTLHQYKEAAKAYRAFLALAGGNLPDEEFEARHRLVALEHAK